jgi:hypothetical protein
MKTLPFAVPRLYWGFGECHGLLRDEGTHLCLEYQVQFGAFRTRPKTVRVPIKDLESVELQKGWFGHTALVLRASSLHAIGHVPGSRQGKVELKIDSKDRKLAEQVVEGLYET